MYARTPLNRHGLVFVLVLHALAFWGLLQMKLISLPESLTVLTVSLLPTAEVIQPPPEIVPPKPRPMERRSTPVQEPTRIAAPAETLAPTPLTVPPALTSPAPPAPVVAAPVAVPTPPRFDADYLDNPKPVYPAISRRLGEQGRVVLRAHVAGDGSASEVQLHTSSGSSRLDQAALDTVRRWKFVPARLGQTPTAAWVLVPIAFTLKD